jgi:hypothetical protein
VAALAFAGAADAQWIVSAYGGAVHTRPASITIEQRESGTSLAFERVPFAGRSLESPIYYGYRLTRRVSSRHGVFVGAEFIHAKIYAERAGVTGMGSHRGASVGAVPMDAVVGRFAMSHGLNFLLGTIGIRRALTGRVTGLVSAGAGPVVPHVEVEVDGAIREDYQLVGVGLHGAVGLEIRVLRCVAIVGEYKLTRARVRAALNTGHLSLNPVSHHIGFGIAVRIGQ